MAETIKNLTDEEKDILKEMGNICVGNSSGTLFQLLGGKVEVCVPNLDVVSVNQLSEYVHEKGKMVYGVNTQVTSHIQGSIFLLFPEADALKIIDKFLTEANMLGSKQTQLGISIIKEVAGIALFAYINTLSSLLKRLIVASVPSFLSGTLEELLNMMLREFEYWGNVCVITTAFKEQSLNIEGSFYLVLNKYSTDSILETMRAL